MQEPRRTESQDTMPMVAAEIRAALEADADLHAPAESPTRPDLGGHQEVRCPACFGEVLGDPCITCRSSGRVSAAVLAAHHARSEGRPSDTVLDSYDETDR